MLSNAETYLQFTDVCGWTPDQWQQRTAAVLTAALVAPGHRHQPPRAGTAPVID